MNDSVGAPLRATALVSVTNSSRPTRAAFSGGRTSAAQNRTCIPTVIPRGSSFTGIGILPLVEYQPIPGPIARLGRTHRTRDSAADIRE